MAYKVIDVSDWQGKIDWKKVKADGVVGAIIRYADGTVLDKRFAENMKNAKAAGVHIGAYIFSRARTSSEAEKEAARLFNACKPYNPDMPLYIDLEDRSCAKYADTVAAAFLNKMKALGGRGGVYANLNWWNNYLTKTAKNYSASPFWLAQYYSKMEYKTPYLIGMWQYSSSGKVNGISGRVDMNKCYVAYWDNISVDVEVVPAKDVVVDVKIPKSVDEIAKEVIAGKWGNGDERVKKLKAAGYDPDAVQKRVNELLETNKIAACANEYAYPTNTDKANYKGGAPTAAYVAGLNKAYPDRSKWGEATRKGASCDVFVGVCVRNAGIDKDFPRGLAEQIPYLAKSPKFKEVGTSAVKNGDIIVYTKTAGGGHICIVSGGKVKEAGHEHYYPKTTDTLAARLSKSGKNWVKVYRAGDPVKPKKTIDELAKEVIEGKWGKGDERKKRLTAAGYDYDAVQKRVNEILSPAWTVKANAWAKKIAADNSYHYVKWASKDVKTHQCPICHNFPAGKYHGWNCIGFTYACWHHGGGLKCKCNDGVISNQVAEKMLKASDAEALKIAREHVGLHDIQVIKNRNGIPKSQWRAGDICMHFDGDEYIHNYYYMGGGKIAESTGSSGKIPNDEQIRIKSYSAKKAKMIIRYIGK